MSKKHNIVIGDRVNDILEDIVEYRKNKDFQHRTKKAIVEYLIIKNKDLKEVCDWN